MLGRIFAQISIQLSLRCVLNSPDFPGLDSLRSERAPAELRSKIASALRSDPNRNQRLRVLRFSFAAAVGALVLGTVLLLPRESVASAVSRVLKTFEHVGRYHRRTYELLDGSRRLISETWVDGTSRKFKAYSPDGTAIPDGKGVGDITAKLGKSMQGLTPRQLMDPALNDKLKSITGNVGVITSEITVDGKKVTDLPEGVKAQIAAMTPYDGLKLPVGGDPDIAYMLTKLSDANLWDITHGVQLEGKTVDRYEVNNAPSGMTLWVDTSTHLPIRVQLKSSNAGSTVTVFDDLDYPTSGP